MCARVRSSGSNYPRALMGQEQGHHRKRPSCSLTIECDDEARTSAKKSIHRFARRGSTSRQNYCTSSSWSYTESIELTFSSRFVWSPIDFDAHEWMITLNVDV